MSKLAGVLPAVADGCARRLALLAASACAEIALLPIGAFVFSRVTFAGLIVNFAAIPLMTVVQIAGMAAVASDVGVAASWRDGPAGSRTWRSKGSSAARRSSTRCRG